MSLEPKLSLSSLKELNYPQLRAGIDFSLTKAKDGQTYIVLEDNWGLTDQQLLIAHDFLPVLQCMTGDHSLESIRKYCLTRFSLNVNKEQITELVSALDRFYFLDTPRYQKRLLLMRQEFRNADSRLPVCAGSSYPGEAGELSALFDSWFDHTNPEYNDITALVAPHIDLRLGGPTFTAAYQHLKNAPPADLYIVLGIGHMGIENLFALTDKDFDTPLGTVRTDSRLVHTLQASAKYDYFNDEWVHRDEHSIEFQAVILKYLLGDVNILPVLCSFSPHVFSKPGAPTYDIFHDFIHALRPVLNAYPKVRVIAGVDFAHVGPRYDQSHSMDQAFIKGMQDNDHELLDALTHWDIDKFQRTMTTTNDQYHICGYSALITMLHLLTPQNGKLLDYRAAEMDDSGSLVSFAGLIF